LGVFDSCNFSVTTKLGQTAVLRNGEASYLCPYPIFSFAPQIFHEFITYKTHRINSLDGNPYPHAALRGIEIVLEKEIK
jgi:hypothetical protein